MSVLCSNLEKERGVENEKMKITYFDEDTIVINLKDGSGVHLSETCLKRVYLDGKVQQYHFEDLDKVNDFLNKLKNYDPEKLYELKDEAFEMLCSILFIKVYFCGGSFENKDNCRDPTEDKDGVIESKDNIIVNLNKYIEHLESQLKDAKEAIKARDEERSEDFRNTIRLADRIIDLEKRNKESVQQLITWRNTYKALEDHTIMVESKLRCWQEEFKTDTPWEAKSKFYADHAIAQTKLENEIKELKTENALLIKEGDKRIMALTQQLITWRNDYNVLDGKVKDLKNQLDLSNLDRQSWKDAYHRLEDKVLEKKDVTPTTREICEDLFTDQCDPAICDDWGTCLLRDEK